MADDIPDTGAVFTFGKSRFADNEPSHFFIKSDPVVAISCGDEHSAVICQNGRVFVFGGNSWGQLGLGHTDEVTRPSCVKWLKPHRALFVACGRAHSVFVTDNHAIYTCGCNEEGQLGAGDSEPRAVPLYVELECDEPRVRQVAAGSNHTAVLTVDGKVFVCGSNTEGQLGLGEETRTCLKFTELKFMEKIAFIECGYYHTVFITTKGVVFVTGDNEGGKLGISNSGNNIYVPVELPMSLAIKSACCGANHTFFLSMDETTILALGSNEQGQLGLPQDVAHVTQPTEINMEQLFDGQQLKLVACGAMHTAFVTENGLLYTCGEGRHNKLCLDEIVDATPDDVAANQYAPKRVSAMNGFVVDNVACGGCHTLLTATKGSDSELTNTGLSVVGEQTRHVALAELPPLQKVPPGMKDEQLPAPLAPRTPSAPSPHGSPAHDNAPDEDGSIDSLEANVSGSHIVNINDLDGGSTSDIPELTKDPINDISSPIEKTELREIIDNMHDMADNVAQKIDNGVSSIKENIDDKIKTVQENIENKVEAVEDVIKKTAVDLDPCKICENRKILDDPDTVADMVQLSPPKTPILPELLQVPNLSHMSPDNSRVSDDGQKSECGSRSENETIPCASDKSSPQNKSAKTQAVMPIVRNEDSIDNDNREDSDVVVNKIAEKGRFSKIFQSIRDKENSCIGKGKVIEEKVEETVHKGINNAEESIHRVEETVVTEIRDQTNSRTCTIL